MFTGIQHLSPKLLLHRLLYLNHRYACDILIQNLSVSFTPEISSMTLLAKNIANAQTEITPYQLPVIRGLLGNFLLRNDRRNSAFVSCAVIAPYFVSQPPICVRHPNSEFSRVIYARDKFYDSFGENYRQGADGDHALSTSGPPWITRKFEFCGARAKESAFMYHANDCSWDIRMMR
ncbi:hypothetical protein CDAR_2081 [Caerostris darwini]|uniref:Uncharacterized protein n=1 Tax=Caerostris darwini TaxID=1538125 RepID=A0AAV4M3L2_9ARAC|nr:hypothetical protein CDAR_2081 [Caerostris darwini]